MANAQQMVKAKQTANAQQMIKAKQMANAQQMAFKSPGVDVNASS